MTDAMTLRLLRVADAGLQQHAVRDQYDALQCVEGAPPPWLVDVVAAMRVDAEEHATLPFQVPYNGPTPEQWAAGAWEP